MKASINAQTSIPRKKGSVVSKEKRSQKTTKNKRLKKEGISQYPATNPKKVNLCKQQEENTTRLALRAQEEAYQDTCSFKIQYISQPPQ